MDQLTDRDLRILAFEEFWLTASAGVREGAILRELGMTPARYFQLLYRIIDSPAAMAARPMQVKRLQRVRGRRVAARSARGFG